MTSTQPSTYAVLGWGHKPTADKARRYAARHGLPYIALEDGFLRSLGLGCEGADPLSLVVDGTGIYYDATCPSDLENLLESTGWETPELLESAARALEDIKRHCLSKYNHAPLAHPGILGDGSKPRVLVIDQTFGTAPFPSDLRMPTASSACSKRREGVFSKAVFLSKRILMF